MPIATTLEEDTDRHDGGLPINELFYSIQGEGKLAGTPSAFIRTSGCNLRCWFCDSYHTSWEPTHAWMEIADVIDEVQAHDSCRHVVLTGGEPMLHDHVETLLATLSDAGYHTTVETNGTIYRDTAIDLASISPKLSSSTPTPQNDPKGSGEWEQTHEQRRLNMDALATLVDTYPSQLKFVVTGQKDIDEIQSLVSDVRSCTETRVRNEDVLLMPEGATRDRLDDTRELVADLAMEHGYRYTPRLHVDLWNDAPGT